MEGRGAIVDIEQDGVVVAIGLANELLNRLDLYLDSLVVEEAGIEMGEVIFIPLDDGGGELGAGEADFLAG